MRHYISYWIRQDQPCSNKKLNIFNNDNAKKINQDSYNSWSTGCDEEDNSPKLKLLSGIDAFAMARNFARAFSLPDTIGK